MCNSHHRSIGTTDLSHINMDNVVKNYNPPDPDEMVVSAQEPPSSPIVIDLPISNDTCATPIIVDFKALSIGHIVGTSVPNASAHNVNDIAAQTNPFTVARIYESNIILEPNTISFPEPLPSSIIATTQLSTPHYVPINGVLSVPELSVFASPESVLSSFVATTHNSAPPHIPISDVLPVPLISNFGATTDPNDLEIITVPVDKNVVKQVF